MVVHTTSAGVPFSPSPQTEWVWQLLCGLCRSVEDEKAWNLQTLCSFGSCSPSWTPARSWLSFLPNDEMQWYLGRDQFKALSLNRNASLPERATSLAEFECDCAGRFTFARLPPNARTDSLLLVNAGVRARAIWHRRVHDSSSKDVVMPLRDTSHRFDDLAAALRSSRAARACLCHATASPKKQILSEQISPVSDGNCFGRAHELLLK